MEENKEVRAVVDMVVLGKDQGAEGMCRNYGSPQRIPRAENSEGQELFAPPTYLEKATKKKYIITTYIIESVNITYARK